MPLGHKRELGGGEGLCYCFSPMVRWFELIAITILCLSYKAFVTYILKGVSCEFMIILFLCKRGT